MIPSAKVDKINRYSKTEKKLLWKETGNYN